MMAQSLRRERSTSSAHARRAASDAVEAGHHERSRLAGVEGGQGRAELWPALGWDADVNGAVDGLARQHPTPLGDRRGRGGRPQRYAGYCLPRGWVSSSASKPEEVHPWRG